MASYLRKDTAALTYVFFSFILCFFRVGCQSSFEHNCIDIVEGLLYGNFHLTQGLGHLNQLSLISDLQIFRNKKICVVSELLL